MQANSHMAQAEQEMALLYRKYAPGLLTYVRMRIRTSDEDAEDLVVEVFVAAIENAKFAALSGKEKQLWLWRVTLSRSLNLLRKIYRRRREEQENGGAG